MAHVLKRSRQFYLYTPRSSANGRNHTCLCLPSRSWYSFTDPEGWKAEFALGGWLVTYQNKCPALGIEPGHVTLSSFSALTLLVGSFDP